MWWWLWILLVVVSITTLSVPAESARPSQSWSMSPAIPLDRLWKILVCLHLSIEWRATFELLIPSQSLLSNVSQDPRIPLHSHQVPASWSLPSYGALRTHDPLCPFVARMHSFYLWTLFVPNAMQTTWIGRYWTFWIVLFEFIFPSGIVSKWYSFRKSQWEWF